MLGHYNLQKIRTLLAESFSEVELRHLCQEVPEFRHVYDNLAKDTSKAEIIDHLLDHAHRKLQVDLLLAAVKERNPARYNEHQPYEAQSSPGSLTEIPSLPLTTAAPQPNTLSLEHVVEPPPQTISISERSEPGFKGVRIEEVKFLGCSLRNLMISFVIEYVCVFASWYQIVINPFPPRIPTPISITTPTPVLASSLTPTNIPPDITVSPTLTLTSTRIPISTLTSTNTPSTVAGSPTSTSTPIPTQAPINTPLLSPVWGIVTVANLNVRWGPGTAYGYTGAVYEGDQVIILGKTPGGFWLEVETPDGKKGWVTAQYISILPPNDITDVPIVSVPPPPPPLPETPLVVDELQTLALRSASAPGKISANQEYTYIFYEDQKETVFALMFKPNVNTQRDYVQFIIYQDRVDESKVVGVGSHPASDWDGDSSTGELIWRGGPLVAGATYYLRIINYSSESIEYCLATSDIYEWRCPE